MWMLYIKSTVELKWKRLFCLQLFIIFLSYSFLYTFIYTFFTRFFSYFYRPKNMSKLLFHYTQFRFRIPELSVCWRRVGCSFCTVYPQNPISSSPPKISDERVCSQVIERNWPQQSCNLTYYKIIYEKLRLNNSSHEI